MLKRSLALGALMAFVITGQAWAGGAKVVSSGQVLDDTIKQVTDTPSNDGRIYGINASGLPSNEKIIFNGEVDVLATGEPNDTSTSQGTCKFIHAIMVQGKPIAGGYEDAGTLETNKAVNLEVVTDGATHSHGVVAYDYAQVNFNNGLNVKVEHKNTVGKTGYAAVNAYGLAADYGAKINVKEKADISLKGNAINIAIQSRGTGAQVVLNGDATILAETALQNDKSYDATLPRPDAMGVEAQSGGVVEFKGAETKITANAENGYVKAVNVLSEAAKLNFNASKVEIVANAKTQSLGLYVGGGASEVSATGDVSVTAHASEGVAFGLRSSNKVDGKVEGEAGSAKLTGNLDVNVEGVSAYGVEAEAGSIVDLGNDNATVKFNITSTGATEAEAQAISAEGGSTVTVEANELSIATTAKSNVVGSLQARNSSTISVAANKATIGGVMYAGEDSTLDISGIKDLVLTGLTKDSAPAIQVEGGTLKVNTSTGTLAIDGATAGNVYKVVSGVGEETKLWSDENLAYDRTTMVATSALDENAKLYTVKYESFDDVENVTDEVKDQFVAAVGGEELAVPGLVAASTGQGSVMEDTAPGAKEFLAAVSSDAKMSKETKAAVINSAAKLAEAGGNAGTAVSVANNVAGVTTGRMSLGGRGHGGHKGGHGVGMFEEGSGAAVWAQYMHGKDEATDMPMDGGATSYESEYDGIVVGVDFKKVGKFQSGIAFNYGEGDSNGFGSGIKTSSEYDFWGVGYYGNIRNEDTNFIFDVNYAKSDSDVTQKNITGDIEASPETTTWSAGVKVEKLYQNNNVQIVPYTGLRYMSIDTDEYQSNVGGDTLFNYAPERQDIWLLPLGVTIKQEVVNDNGWVVTPKVDLSYIWAFGDTDSNMSVSIPGIAASNDTLGFTVMDDGSFLGLVGVEAKMDDWTFGVSYSYQKGDYAESKKWFVDAKYSF